MYTLGYSALGISFPVFVAHAKGYFNDVGVSVTTRSWPTAHPVVDAIIDDGDPRFGGFIAYPIAFHRHLRARPLYYAGAVLEDRENPISFLLVRNGSGIETLADLGNRKVGVLPTKAYREWLKLLGKRAGLNYHQILLDKTCKCMKTESDCVSGRPTMKVFDVQPRETVEALRSGAVDAIFTNDPGASAALKAGVAHLWGEDPILPSLLQDPYYFGSFVFDSRFVIEQPETTLKIVQALDEGVRFVRSNPHETREIARRYLPGDCGDPTEGIGKPLFLTSDEVDAGRLQLMANLVHKERIVGGRLEVAPWILRSDSIPERPAEFRKADIFEVVETVPC